MPRRTENRKATVEVLAPIPAEILDQLVREGPLTAAEVESATRRFKKALIERALGAELSHHLGYAPGTPKPEITTNHRTGRAARRSSPMMVRCHRGAARSRGDACAQLIGKHERRLTGLDDKVIALYARGLTVREIQAFLKDMYAVAVSPDLISAVDAAGRFSDDLKPERMAPSEKRGSREEDPIQPRSTR